MSTTAEIIAIGTEILMGQITNTNARFISETLPDVGVYVYYHTVVGDNKERIQACLKAALERTDFVITTGGLGPTQDDITKEMVAQVLNLDMKPDREALEVIQSFYKKAGRTMTDNNTKQAYFPEGAHIMRNKHGTAPGCIVQKEGKTVIMLPGPPGEMKPMFTQSVLPYLAKKGGQKLKSIYIRLFGIGESAVEDAIMDLVSEQSNPTIAPYASVGQVMLRVTARYSKEMDIAQLMDPVINEITNRLGPYIYSFDNKELHEVVCETLLQKNITLALAESCTGGLVSARITEYPGISAVYKGCFVAYSNEMKSESLGVPESTFESYGAVSRETAVLMAKGALEKTKADLALGITGIAGPGGGTKDKPVGKVFICLADRDNTYVKEPDLWGDRNRIRINASLHAFDMIRRYLHDEKL